jgi:hypothetical protein
VYKLHVSADSEDRFHEQFVAVPFENRSNSDRFIATVTVDNEEDYNRLLSIDPETGVRVRPFRARFANLHSDEMSDTENATKGKFTNRKPYMKQEMNESQDYNTRPSRRPYMNESQGQTRRPYMNESQGQTRRPYVKQEMGESQGQTRRPYKGPTKEQQQNTRTKVTARSQRPDNHSSI